MSIDFNKYTAQQKVEQKEWKPPTSETLMDERSGKLALSTRCYPEYILAAYAFLQEHRNADADSLSNLIYKIICDYINQNMDQIGSLPDAETALDFMIMEGWISTENKENILPIGKIRQKQEELQAKMAEGSASLKEQWEFWKDRDPEKAEEIMEKMTEELGRQLSEDEADDKPDWKEKKQQAKQEEIAGDNRASLDYLEDVPTAKEDDYE